MAASVFNNSTASTTSAPSPDVNDALSALKESLNDFFLSVMSIFIYTMQAGFAMLEAGSVRSKNVTNILMKNLLDSFVGSIAYYIIGYALAFGDPGNAFCGTRYWALSGLSPSRYSHVLFNFMFSATAASIVSGAVADRCEFVAYLCYCTFISGFVYPVVSHWVWSRHGWLASSVVQVGGQPMTLRFQDFAGSGVVHLLGGTASFVAAAILGPRVGRFSRDAAPAEVIRGHSVPLTTLGGFILFCGFLAFNGSSQGSITESGDGRAVALAMLNTVLSGSSSAIVVMAIGRLRWRRWSLLSTINGGLTGMVSICAGCNSVAPWSSIIIGSVSALSYLACSAAVLALRIDDPVDAVGVHFGGGITGVLLVSLFHSERGVFINPSVHGGMDLLWQLVGALAIVLWSGGLSLAVFGCLRLLGLFRVSEDLERKGLDVGKHGEPAYPSEAFGDGWESSKANSTINGNGADNSLRQDGVTNRGLDVSEF